MNRLVLALLCAAFAFPALAETAPPAPAPGSLGTAPPSAPGTVSAGRLENVRIFAPQDKPKAMVVYFSDLSGWQASDDAIVSSLTDDGDAVLGVDMAAYKKKLDADDGVCLYVVGEITDLAQTAQRQLDIQTYLPPIVAGSGEGATFAYAAIADSPVNTLGGAVASGFENRLTLRWPFCPGSTATKAKDGKSFSYAFDSPPPNPTYLFVDADKVDAVSDQAANQKGITVQAIEPEDRGRQIADAVDELSDIDQPFGDLPAIDLPATTPPRALAILVSGDGGWRDVDKKTGDWLAEHGVHVIGVDALHYFWSKRTPEELARDVTALVRTGDPKGRLPIMLIGYSFGADTLPFAFPKMPLDIQNRTKVFGLMAPSTSTSFQVTISGWLGIDDSGYDTAAAIAALPKGQVLCIYGKDEDETACTDPRLSKTEVIAAEGGHHFDENYTALAARMLDAAHLD